MTGVAALGGIFVIAFVSAFIPLVSIELALVAAAATGTSGRLLVAYVVVAAAGQMAGKTCFFVTGREVIFRWRRRHASNGRFSRLHARAARQRGAAAVTVLASAVTGLPPFALVSALAGAWRLRLPAFFVLGLTGRSTRFAGVLLVPQAPGL